MTTSAEWSHHSPLHLSIKVGSTSLLSTEVLQSLHLSAFVNCSDIFGEDGTKYVVASALCSYQVCLGQLGELDMKMSLK